MNVDNRALVSVSNTYAQLLTGIIISFSVAKFVKRIEVFKE
jgi:hypothetical protein